MKLYGSAINHQILLVCLYGEIRWAEIANFGGERSFRRTILAEFDSRTVTIVKLLVKSLCAHMCTLISPILLCTYVHIKPKLILFNTVAPPASCTNINSLSTKPMFQTFHLEPINDVLCKELGLWGDWSGLLHLPNYCAHMCTIIFHRGLCRNTDSLGTNSPIPACFWS